MSLDRLLDELVSQKVELWSEGDRLRYRGPKEALTNDVLDKLRQHKADLLKRLGDRPAPFPQTDGSHSRSVFPLSHGQRALWFLHQTAPQSAAYNAASAVRIRSSLDLAAFRRALETLVGRHPSLRTTFHRRDGQPVQQIHPNPEIHFQHINASTWSDATFVARVDEAYRRPFDLETGPVMRVHLFSRSETEHVFLLTIHHVACDAWSIFVLQDELRLLYAAEVAGKQAALLPMKTSYAAYVRWQADMLKSQAGHGHWSYWREQLSGELPILDLPTDRPRPPVQTYRGNSLAFCLPEDLSRQFGELARSEGATLYMALLAAFQVLLYRYTNQEDILVGCPTTGRSKTEFAGLVGYFVNPVVMRADLSGNPSFRDYLKDVRARVLAALKHQDLPFALLVERLKPNRDPSRSPLFQVAFVHQRPQRFDETARLYAAGSPNTQLDVDGITLEPFELAQQEGQFDLTLEMLQADGSLYGVLKYSTDLFEPDTIGRMADHFQILLESIIQNPDQHLGQLPLLSKSQRRRLLVEWNATQLDVPMDLCIHQWFEAQAKESPQKSALSFRDQQLTYRELNERANQVARYLVELGVGPEVLVGICAARSVEMVVGILGVLKAGGAYVPLDPEYPRQRLAFMLEDTQAPVLLADQRISDSLPAYSGRIVYLDFQRDEITRQNPDNLDRTVTADNLAYVIYTSGSTGQPKGVMIAHRSAGALIAWAKTVFGPEDLGGVLASTSICFDLSIFELFVTLGTGGKVILVENVLQLQEADRRSDVTLVNTVPSVMAELLRSGRLPESVRTVNLAGEPLSSELVEQIYQSAMVQRVFDLYGPSEDTTYSTYTLRRQGGPATIGRPIANTQVYLLDRHLQPVPQGVPGEIYIGGAGLARGYLNRPQLTADRFVSNPFSQDPDSRLYRTGDLARYRADGNLEFLGRTDHQVKIRGFRIELGEIESVLVQHPSVEEAAVLAREDRQGQKRLVAYAVPCQGDDLSVEDLRGFLGGELPSFMVPSLFVTLRAMPRTPNGKLDRKALPAPDGSRPNLEKKYAPPHNPTEEALANIWRDLLGLDRVGVLDNFFELGGDSILSIQFVSRARGEGLFFTPFQLFQHQTVAELAGVAAARPGVAAEQGDVTGPVELTPIQRWLLDASKSDPCHFHQWLLLELRSGVDLSQLDHAVSQWPRHHDALRLRFCQRNGRWSAEIAPVSEDPIFHALDLSSMPRDEQETAIQARIAGVHEGIDIQRGPLVRAEYFDLGSQRPPQLLIAIHHLAVDGVSWRTLVEDLHLAIEQLARGQRMELLPKTTSYQEWARRLRQRAESPAMAKESSYWLSRANGRLEGIPEDGLNGANTVASTGSTSVSLDTGRTEALVKEAPAAYRTGIDDVLLTALVRSYHSWSGQSQLLLDLESHGREPLWEDIDLSRTVGWFTSLYPVVLRVRSGCSPGEAIKAVKEQMRAIPQNGIGYGLLRYIRDGQVAQHLAAQPQASVVFNYMGQLDLGLDGYEPLFQGASLAHGLYRSPESIRAHAVEINAYVKKGRLQVDWTYSRNRHRQERICGWAQGFIESLEELVDGRHDPAAGRYTPSDFPAARISEKDLHKLLAKVRSQDGK